MSDEQTKAFSDRVAKNIEDLRNEISTSKAEIWYNEIADDLETLLDSNERLREALTKIRDCDFVITPADRMDAVREIARKALLVLHHHHQKGHGMSDEHDKSTPFWKDETPVMSIEKLSQVHEPMTRDGVPLEVGMMVYDGNMMPTEITAFDSCETPRESVDGSYYFYIYGKSFSRFGKATTESGLRPENTYADPQNALHMGGWSRSNDRIQQLTAERDELKKIINGPDENTVVASSFGEGEPFTLTPEKLQDKMDEWNKNDSYPTGYTFVMTEGIWNTLSWGVISRYKKAEADLAAANKRVAELEGRYPSTKDKVTVFVGMEVWCASSEPAAGTVVEIHQGGYFVDRPGISSRYFVLDGDGFSTEEVLAASQDGGA